MAISPAEKQRAYRERQRSKNELLSNVTVVNQRADEIVSSLNLDSLDIDQRSYFIGLLVGSCCSDLKISYLVAGLFDAAGNVTELEQGGN